MNIPYDVKDQQRLLAARESYSGRLLTNSQFDEAIAITGILDREIQRSGAFREKLGDYAHAFARTQRFDALKSETIIRDLYKERTGQSLNQAREALMQREQHLGVRPQEGQEADHTGPTEAVKNRAYQVATEVGDLIRDGDKMSFFRAYTHQAEQLATEYGITESAARSLMRSEFKAAENQELSDAGKVWEEQYYRPQIEAAKQEREQNREQDYSRDRSGPSR